MTEQGTTILLVAVDPESGAIVTDHLARHRLGHAAAATAAQAVHSVVTHHPAAVLVDTDAGAAAVVPALRRADRVVPILIVTSEIGGQSVIEAMTHGIAAVLKKPLSEGDLGRSLRRALDNRRVAAEIASLRSELQEGSRPRLVLGRDDRMAELARLVGLAADTDVPVLIEGEAGTGKDLVARVIHDLSPRRSGPFVKVNCASLTDGALESELFGFEQGAFLGAVRHKPGKLDFAHHGTLFLDEVGAMTPALQAKLLHVLQEGVFSRMGSVARVRADARLVASASTSLAAAVAAGAFREDLYFRLNVVAVRLPPLRERREDILSLAEHFLRTFSLHCNKACPTLAPETRQLLREYEWPGNVRELRDAVRRLVLPGGEAEVRRELRRAVEARTARPEAAPDLAVEPATAERAAPAARTLKEIARAAARAAERAAIFTVLQRTRWNRKAAAEFLGISYKALLYKIRENGLDKPAPTS